MSGGGKKKPKVAKLNLVPTTVDTGFGNAVINPKTGQASYTLDPRLAAMRDIFYGASQDFIPSTSEQEFTQSISDYGQQMYGRGVNLLDTATGLDPREIGQSYYNDVRGLQEDARAAEEARLADTLFRTGRTGLGTSYGGGYINPQQFSLLKAREEADRALAIQAEELGRNRRTSDTQYASGLMNLGTENYGTGIKLGMMPYQATADIFGLGTNIEKLGFMPFEAAMGINKDNITAAKMMQENQQAINNAKASGGFGGLLGGIANAGVNYALSGGLSGLGSSLSSGWSSLFSNPVSNLGSWTPINTNIGMGGYNGPVNFGGGILGPNMGQINY